MTFLQRVLKYVRLFLFYKIYLDKDISVHAVAFAENIGKPIVNPFKKQRQNSVRDSSRSLVHHPIVKGEIQVRIVTFMVLFFSPQH